MSVTGGGGDLFFHRCPHFVVIVITKTLGRSCPVLSVVTPVDLIMPLLRSLQHYSLWCVCILESERKMFT